MTEPTNHEIIEKLDVLTDMVQSFATHVDARFDKVYADMATKDFIDRRLNQLDAKVGILTDTLEKKGVISKDEAHDVMIAS